MTFDVKDVHAWQHAEMLGNGRKVVGEQPELRKKKTLKQSLTSTSRQL